MNTTNDDFNCILVRENGAIQIFVYSETKMAEQVWQGKETEEAITGLCVGNVTST